MTGSKVCIIGDSEAIMVFNAIGVKTFFIDKITDKLAKKQATSKILNKAIDNNYKLILITRDLANEVSKIIDLYKTSVYPIILKIDLDGDRAKSTEDMQKIVKKAIGVSLDV